MMMQNYEENVKEEQINKISQSGKININGRSIDYLIDQDGILIINNFKFF